MFDQILFSLFLYLCHVCIVLSLDFYQNYIRKSDSFRQITGFIAGKMVFTMLKQWVDNAVLWSLRTDKCAASNYRWLILERIKNIDLNYLVCTFRCFAPPKERNGNDKNAECVFWSVEIYIYMFLCVASASAPLCILKCHLDFFLVPRASILSMSVPANCPLVNKISAFSEGQIAIKIELRKKRSICSISINSVQQ